MQPEILESFEYQSQTILIRLEEDASDRDWLIVRAYYADGMLVNKWVYSVHKEERLRLLSKGEEDPIQEFVRSLRFDIESEARQELKQSRRENQSAHQPKPSYEPTSCRISIARGAGLQKY